jgi:hypothetical protein
MKKKKIIFLISLLILIVLSVLYHLPTKVNKTISVCTLEGETAKVTYHVTWNKHFFKPTELRGTITINGKEYQSILDTNMKYDYGNMFDKLNMKFHHDRYTSPFVILNKDVKNGSINESLNIYLFNNTFNRVMINLFDDEGGATYFGAANTAQEAENVRGDFYIDKNHFLKQYPLGNRK